jgi:mycofactocin system glycosyltransferase
VIPLPEGFSIELDRTVRIYGQGRVLVGGTPLRARRLSGPGRMALEALTAGLPASAAARVLGRGLVDAGMARALPGPGAATGAITCVIPARDRPAELDRCLASLGGESAAIVVDDASEAPAAIASVCARHGVRLLHRDAGGGPAAARNTALGDVGTEHVAFLDSDCVASPHWGERLAAQFADPCVGAVAPRVRPLAEASHRTVRERFLAARSPLDMGPVGGDVRRGGRIPYVPSAALIVRRSALGGGFDDELRYGEDVDLVWRLADAGWRIRYVPEVVVHHAEPRSWMALVARRFRYGTSAAPLARRHPGALPPLTVHAGAGLAAFLLLRGRFRIGTLVAAAGGVRAGWLLHGAGAPFLLGPLLGLRATGAALLAAGRAGRLAAPIVVPLWLVGRRRRPSRAAVLVLPAIAEWWSRRPDIDPLRWCAAAAVDDAAYDLGVVVGCARFRTVEPVVPSVAGLSDAARPVIRAIRGLGRRPRDREEPDSETRRHHSEERINPCSCASPGAV